MGFISIRRRQPARSSEPGDEARAFARGARTVADLIAPGAFEVGRDHVRLDHHYARVLALTNYPRTVAAGWTQPLVDFDEPHELSLHIQPRESGEAVTRLTHQMVRYHSSRLFDALAALAALTRRIRLGTQVTSVNYRPPALLARIVADVDRISGGRVVLGVGIGDDPADSARLGVPYPSVRERQAALDDALRLLRPLLAGEEAAPPGGERILLEPGPVQPRVPILLAGGGEKVTLRQVAEHADASNFGAGSPVGNAWTLDDVRRKYAVLREHCRTVGRPYESVLRTHFVGLLEFGEGVETREESFTSGLGHRYLILRADPAGAVAHCPALTDAGVQYVIVAGLDDPRSVRLFGERVLPAFR